MQPLSSRADELLIAAVEILWLFSLLAGLAGLCLIVVANKQARFKFVNAAISAACLALLTALISGWFAPSSAAALAMPLAALTHFAWLCRACRNQMDARPTIRATEPVYCGPP